MQRSDNLYPSEVIYFCGDINRILERDITKVNALKTALENFVYYEQYLQGASYDSIRAHLKDYILILNTIVDSFTLISDKVDLFSFLMGTEDLVGEKIFDEIERLERLLTTLFEDSRQWEHEKQMYPDKYVYQTNPYSTQIEANQIIKKMWEGQKIMFDSINSRSVGLFSLEMSALTTSRSFIDEVSGRVRNGRDIQIDTASVLRKRMTDYSKQVREAQRNFNADKFNLIAEIDSQEVVDAFWLTNDMFKDPLWYYDDDKLKMAAAYLRADIRMNGPYALIRAGEVSSEELLIYRRQMILVNALANQDKTPRWNDHTLDGLENICAWAGKDYYKIGWNDGHYLTEEMLDIMLKYNDQMKGKDFGKWYEAGGHYIFDTVFEVTTEVCNPTEGFYDQMGYAIQQSTDATELYDSTDVVDYIENYYNVVW